MSYIFSRWEIHSTLCCLYGCPSPKSLQSWTIGLMRYLTSLALIPESPGKLSYFCLWLAEGAQCQPSYLIGAVNGKLLVLLEDPLEELLQANFLAATWKLCFDHHVKHDVGHNVGWQHQVPVHASCHSGSCTH